MSKQSSFGSVVRWGLSLLVAALTTASLLAQSEGPGARIESSSQVFRDLANAPNGLPINLLNKASCIIILPSVKKAAFIVGANTARE